MMMIPRRNDYDLWDDIFGKDPFFDRKAVEKVMKTDIREKDGNYMLEMDLPGYDKENIEISIEDGYLTVNAKVDNSKEDTDKKESYIRKERYFGECSRSFYVGENVTEDDVKASFKNGKLTLVFPKEEEKKVEGKKLIQID